MRDSKGVIGRTSLLILCAFLVASGYWKFHGGWEYSITIPPTVYYGAAACEIAVGFGLATPLWKQSVVVLQLGLVASIVFVMSGMTGRNCGCLGRGVTLSPTWHAALDGLLGVLSVVAFSWHRGWGMTSLRKDSTSCSGSSGLS